MADQDQEQRRGGIGGIGDGIRTGLGILSAFKEAVEETLQEAVDRGDLSAERARQTMRDVVQRAQTTFDDAKLRLDVVSRPEFDALSQEVDRLRDRVAKLEGPGGGASPSEAGGIIIAPE